MAFIAQKFELFVADLARSTRFYCDLLGFSVDPDSKPDYVTLRNGPVVISLAPFEGLPGRHHFRRGGGEERGVGVEFCLYASEGEVEALHARAKSEASIRLEPLRARPWGTQDFRLIDPDGYYLRISTGSV